MAGRKQTRARGATAAAAAGRTPTALVVLGLCVALVWWAFLAHTIITATLSVPIADFRLALMSANGLMLVLLLRLVVLCFMTVRLREGGGAISGFEKIVSSIFFLTEADLS